MNPFTVGVAFSEGWQVMKKNYGVFLGASFVYMLTVIVVSAIPIIGVIVYFFAVPPLFGGWFLVGIKGYRESVEFRDLFGGFKKYASMLGLFWLLALIFLATFIPLGISALLAMTIASQMRNVGIVLMVIGGLISIVIMLVISVRTLLCFAICLDSELWAVDSLKKCWNVTAPHTWTLVGLLFCLIVVNSLLALPLFIPWLFLGLPWALGIIGVIYSRIVGPVEIEGQVVA